MCTERAAKRCMSSTLQCVCANRFTDGVADHFESHRCADWVTNHPSPNHVSDGLAEHEHPNCRPHRDTYDE